MRAAVWYFAWLLTLMRLHVISPVEFKHRLKKNVRAVQFFVRTIIAVLLHDCTTCVRILFVASVKRSLGASWRRPRSRCCSFVRKPDGQCFFLSSSPVSHPKSHVIWIFFKFDHLHYFVARCVNQERLPYCPSVPPVVRQITCPYCRCCGMKYNFS